MRRIGCLLTLVVCLAFWALVAFVAINVFAASREAQDPGSAAGLIGPGLRGTPHVGEAAVVAVASRNAGVPTPEQARTEALGAMVEGEIGTVLLSGTASWYCGDVCTRGYPDGLYAAAGRELQVGDWRGSEVTVCADGCVTVTLIDVCRCPGARIIDLYRMAFSRIADPSRGVVPVTIEYGGPRMTLPPTSTAEGATP